METFHTIQLCVRQEAKKKHWCNEDNSLHARSMSYLAESKALHTIGYVQNLAAKRPALMLCQCLPQVHVCFRDFVQRNGLSLWGKTTTHTRGLRTSGNEIFHHLARIICPIKEMKNLLVYLR